MYNIIVLSKGAFLFKSGLTKNIYKNFLKYLIHHQSKEEAPYVYVEANTKKIRFLAEISKSPGQNEIEALSFSKFGDIELLSTE